MSDRFGMNAEQRKRFAFWEANETMAMLMLGHASSPSSGVVVIADMRDTVGKSISDALSVARGMELEAREHFEKITRKGEIPTTIMIFDQYELAKVLEVSNAKVANVLRTSSPAPGSVWVIVIAEEGTMLLQVPRSPITAQGQT